MGLSLKNLRFRNYFHDFFIPIFLKVIIKLLEVSELLKLQNNIREHEKISL